MAKKRPQRTVSTGWWALVVAAAGLLGWLLWNSGKAPADGGPASATPTNRIDFARATNLLHWVATNLSSISTSAALAPVVMSNPPPPVLTNRLVIRSNLVVIPPPAPTTVKTQVAVVASLPAPVDRPVRDLVEAQIALARQAISSGPIDGIPGSQTRAALRAFQKQNHLPPTGELDAATRNTLRIAEPVFTTYLVTAFDLAQLQSVPDSWLGKASVEALSYETALEMVAERHQASHEMIRRLNPTLNFSSLPANTLVRVPNLPRPAVVPRAAFIRIQLGAKTLQAYDSSSNLLAHFPCSIASRVEKRPVGVLTVVTSAENPNYTFNPEIFPESEEARRIDRKLIIPPGPNNPVGAAWISLDKPGYGIHGTPRPDQVGRTESHGCFRLANWNAEFLLKLVWAGMPVHVEP